MIPQSSSGSIYLAEPRGFCAGVRRALDTVEKALSHYSSPIYVYHEIVHNDFVVNELKRRGVIFVEDIASVPSGSILILSAHGASAKVEKEASERDLKLIDATCPLVKRIHGKAEELHHCDTNIYLIGHRGHPEVTGTMGRIGNNGTIIENEKEATALTAPANNKRSVCLTQTTLSTDDTANIINSLKKVIPQLETIESICYATKNRQDAVKKLCEVCDDIIVIGSAKSSNSNRLRETAEKAATKAVLINSAKDLPDEILKSRSNIGITAGASAPEYLVNELIAVLETHGRKFAGSIVVEQEQLCFKLPAFPEK